MKRVLKWLKTHSTFLLILMSSVMLLGGIVVDLLVWFGVIASGEPTVVLHLSTNALIFSGAGNLLTAIVNQKIEDK